MKVAVVQTQAFGTSEGDAALEHALTMISQAACQKPDLVILPECAYPGYFLGGPDAPGTSFEQLDNALGHFREAARSGGFYLAVGMPERVSGKLYNSGFFIDPSGEVSGRVRKAFLWHFDSLWFDPGDEYPVIDTPFGPIGLLVCADARMPEIPRLLRMKGARLIVDMTNWVATGNQPESLTNPQFEFMAPVRAIENGAWFAAANKVGIERQAALFCGHSCVLNPAGQVIAAASAHRPEVVFAEVDLQAGPSGALPGIDIMAGRRPEAYAAMCEPSPNFRPAGPAEPLFLACIQARPGRAFPGLSGTIPALCAGLAVCADAGVLSESGVEPGEWAMKMGMFLAVAEGSGRNRKAFLYFPDGRKGMHVKTHGTDSTSVGEPPVFDLPWGKLALLIDEEAYFPEVARVAALRGADMIVWMTEKWYPLADKVARTRAAENACFVVACGPAGDPGSEGYSLVASPQGSIMAAAIPGAEQIIMAQIIPVLARIKQIVPGTDAFGGRRPGHYALLAGRA